IRRLRRSVMGGVQVLEALDSLERSAGGCGEQPGRSAGVQLLEGRGEPVARRGLWCAQAERLEVVDREARRGAGEDPGQLGPEGDGAKRRVLVLPVVLAVAVEPAVRRRLHPRPARLAVVMRIAVAARRVTRGARVY